MSLPSSSVGTPPSAEDGTNRALARRGSPPGTAHGTCHAPYGRMSDSAHPCGAASKKVPLFHAAGRTPLLASAPPRLSLRAAELRATQSVASNTNEYV